MILFKKQVTPASECGVSANEEDEEKQMVPSHPIGREALTALSILDSAVRCTDVDDSIVNAMDTMQELVSKIYKNFLTQ
jgi:hypothetical protein